MCHKSHLFFYVLQVKSQSQLWKALTLTLWLLLVCQWCPWWDGLHFAVCWNLWSKARETSPRNGKLLSIPQGTLTVLHTHIIIYFCFRRESVEYELPSHCYLQRLLITIDTQKLTQKHASNWINELWSNWSMSNKSSLGQYVSLFWFPDLNFLKQSQTQTWWVQTDEVSCEYCVNPEIMLFDCYVVTMVTT